MRCAWSAQEVRDRETQLLLHEMSLIMTPVLGSEKASLEQARLWTLQQWAEDLFPVSS